jgi:GABA(A) receptor-associated protein
MEFIDEFKKTEWVNRLAKSQKFRQTYPNRIPVIVDRGNKSTPLLVNNKFIIPLEMQEIVSGEAISRITTVAHFMQILRKYIPELTSEKAIFLFIAGRDVIPQMTQSMSQLYEEYREKCGFLYITYVFESTFGNSTKKLPLTI